MVVEVGLFGFQVGGGALQPTGRVIAVGAQVRVQVGDHPWGVAFQHAPGGDRDERGAGGVGRVSSIAGIARELNDKQVPCPSKEDPQRNGHRRNDVWPLRSVASIPSNPRYTGHEVWNRQRTDRDPIDPADPGRGYREVPRWNPASEWVISARVVHPPLVSEQDFVAVQAIRSTRPAADGSRRVYLLAGLMCCGLCGRRMDAHWVNNRPGYRCRHGHTSAKPADATQPGNLYVREDETMVYLSGQFARLGADLNQRSLIKELRDHGVTIICDVGGWLLGTEAVHASTSKVPAQRRPDQLF